MDPTVVITARGEQRLRAGHSWIYRSDVADARAGAGDVVRVLGPRGRHLGRAFYSDRSEIAVRLLSRREEPVDRAFWRGRLAAALDYRRTLAIDADAYRLVHGDGDLLPSLIVDRYGPYLVVQALSQAAERHLGLMGELLVELAAPAGILARNDARVRGLEGLDRRVEPIYGEVPSTVAVRQGPILLEADLWKGQKTGLFLDQRENHEAAARYAHGRLLDAFSYQGGFALRLAPRCTDVIAVDASEDAVAGIRGNAARNGLAVDARAANVFDLLRALERAREPFDTIVLDPPAFAKNRAAVRGALAGYKEINLRALKLLAPGGILVTCSCSYHVSELMLLDLVRDAAADAGATVVLLEKRTQARDHPVLLGVPETLYLKCLILRRVA